MFEQKHFYLNHFWVQLGNSLMIALAVGVLTLTIATLAAFAISRLKVRGGRTVLNLALFTYFIPAAFLAVPGWQTPCPYRPPAFSHSDLLLSLALPALEHAASASAIRTTPPHLHGRIVVPSLSRASPASRT